jgi:hypothetical protein
MIEHRRDHAFKADDPTKKRPKCGAVVNGSVCGLPKGDMAHIGTTKSVNEFLSKDIFVYRGLKSKWELRLLDLLDASPLEPCGRIVAEGEMVFPRRHLPDQGNHRFLIEKALGDALQLGKYLPDDDWSRYEFGALSFSYEPGVAATRLVLFPAAEPLDLLPEKTPAKRPASPPPQDAALFAV